MITVEELRHPDQKKTACYDIDVEVDDTLKTQMNSFLLSTASQQVKILLCFNQNCNTGESCYLSAPQYKNPARFYNVLIYFFQEIQSLDNKIHETVETINTMKTHREFYLSFAKDPQLFINKWLISQSRGKNITITFE